MADDDTFFNYDDPYEAAAAKSLSESRTLFRFSWIQSLGLDKADTTLLV